MRTRAHSMLERYRYNPPNMPMMHTTGADGHNGWFSIPFGKPVTSVLKAMASVGNKEIPWEHVSVSLPDRCPTWEEMCVVKNIFWDSQETVVQYHPAATDYVNCYPYCLHLWKPIGIVIPTPPPIAVGPKKFISDDEASKVIDQYMKEIKEDQKLAPNFTRRI